jgi:hypothetical protein
VERFLGGETRGWFGTGGESRWDTGQDDVAWLLVLVLGQALKPVVAGICVDGRENAFHDAGIVDPSSVGHRFNSFGRIVNVVATIAAMASMRLLIVYHVQRFDNE